MNIYEKLQTCRVELQNAGLKKSGENKFSGYDYFELADFLPKINELFLQNKMCGVVNFGLDLAILEIVNTERPDEKITFTSPMAEAQLKGCHPVQNLGAVETYQRRYLYMAAMEIVETDPLDSGKLDETDKPKPDNKPKQDNKPKSNNKVKSNQPTDLEKRATAIYYHYCGNKKGQMSMTNDSYQSMLKNFADEGHISTTYGKKWTLEDIIWLEAQIEELPF